MPRELPKGKGFHSFVLLELSESGRFVDGDRQVPDAQIVSFLKRKLNIERDVSDVFVWVHGWRNDRQAAIRTAARLFHGIEHVYRHKHSCYPALKNFKAVYVAVHWPSESLPFYSGYRKIRDRAHAMTTNGTAEFALAALLGYLEQEKPIDAAPRTPGLLRAKGGYFVHCVGHSFGGRFLSEAIAQAADPRLPILGLRPAPAGFAFAVDTLLIFQMAAPEDFFGGKLAALLSSAPLAGPVCLTFSSADRANCFWHRKAEGIRAIGCQGANAPAGQISTTRMRPVDEKYDRNELISAIVNVDASSIFQRSSLLSPQGAHSDFWYEESVHLLLTLAHFAR